MPQSNEGSAEHDFTEIAHSGGRVAFRHHEEGMSSKFSQSNYWGFAMYQVCVSFEGRLLSVVPPTGIGTLPLYPRPSILAYVISDREEMFGRSCAGCASYFRMRTWPDPTTCPYCGRTDSPLQFTTQNQLEFISAYCSLYIESMRTEEDREVDLDELARGLDSNLPG